jgi:hypothetical protein
MTETPHARTYVILYVQNYFILKESFLCKFYAH